MKTITKQKKRIEKTKNEIIKVNKKRNCIEQRNNEISINPENLILQAINKGMPVETIEKLLAMRTQLKQEWAKEQYDLAMAKFQGECPIIKKEKEGAKTNLGEIAYYFAPIEAIVSQVKDIIKDNGFSYGIETETLEKEVIVNCIVKHSAGHSEKSSIKIPFGIKTNIMSAPQVVASAITFATRYAFRNAFGIITGDKDDDSMKNMILGNQNKEDTKLKDVSESIKKEIENKSIEIESKKESEDKKKKSINKKVENKPAEKIFNSEEKIKEILNMARPFQNYLTKGQIEFFVSLSKKDTYSQDEYVQDYKYVSTIIEIIKKEHKL